MTFLLCDLCVLLRPVHSGLRLRRSGPSVVKSGSPPGRGRKLLHWHRKTLTLIAYCVELLRGRRIIRGQAQGNMDWIGLEEQCMRNGFVVGGINTVTSPYLCLRPLSCGAAIGLPGLLEGAGGARGRRRETYDLAEGSSRCSGPVRPFWSNPVKPSQSENRGFTVKSRRGCEIS